MREIREVKSFSRDQLAALAMSAAKMAIIGDFYKGTIHHQDIEWKSDGSIDVITTHTPV